jgi:hypothetical protein
MKSFLNNMYKMDIDKRNKLLFQLFGWNGLDAYKFLSEARLRELEDE